MSFFGWWARDELTQDSDVDLLIVGRDDFRIGRVLYREWDARPLSWNGLPVEPRHVHLPQPGTPLTGTWAEVAVERAVLYDRDLMVSRVLVAVRHKIVSGQIIRRRLHGQSYWVEAA